MAKTIPVPAESYVEIRNKALASNWRKLGFSPTEKNPNVWGIIMEIGYPQVVVTLIALNNGTVDLYFGNGSGVTGGGAFEYVRQKSDQFFQAAEKALKKLSPTKNFPFPDVDRVRFYVMTFSGILTGQDNKNIANEDRSLYELFHSGHEVIAALREIDEAGTKNAERSSEGEVQP
jgi:hypothetical protein